MQPRDSQFKEREREAAVELERYERWRKTQPCKNKQAECRQDGGCLCCDADCGEACRG